jgi:hypothetical protein
MHCTIPTLNNALVLMIQGDLTPRYWEYSTQFPRSDGLFIKLK